MPVELVIRWLAVFRVLLGIALIAQAVPLVDRDVLDRFSGQLNSYALNNPIDAYQWLVYSVALPQAQYVGSAIIIGQLLCGLSFVLGFLCRQFAYLGIAFSVLLFVSGAHLGWTYQHESVLLFGLFLFALIVDIGQYYGLDGYFFKKFVPIKVNAQASKKAKPKPKKQKPEPVIDYTEDDDEPEIDLPFDDEDDDEEDDFVYASQSKAKKKLSKKLVSLAKKRR